MPHWIDNINFDAENLSLHKYFYICYLWEEICGYNNTYWKMLELWKDIKKKYGCFYHRYNSWKKRRARLDGAFLRWKTV